MLFKFPDPPLPYSQKGATLIVVLVMLVLIMLVGTWAIRGSITSLNIATNAQAQALLTQSSDSVFFGMENKTSDKLNFANMRIGDGILAYVLRPENKGKELVFCIRGNTQDNLAGTRLASVIYWEGSTIKNADMGANGFCKAGQTTDFISGRKAVLTQVAIRAAENEDWDGLVEVGDIESSKGIGNQKVILTATSILPNFSTASISDINSCLKGYTSFVDQASNMETVTDCLANKNVPYSTQDMEYTLTQSAS